MFYIYDYINKSEFVKKLKQIFDGKYSSLKNIPSEFKPISHQHDCVDFSSSNSGFVSSDTLKELSEKVSEKFIFPSEREAENRFMYEDMFIEHTMWYRNVEPSKAHPSTKDFVNLLRNKYEYKISEARFLNNIQNIYPLFLFSHNVFYFGDYCSAENDGEISECSFSLEASEEIFLDYDNYVYLSQYPTVAIDPLFIPITFVFRITPGNYDICLGDLLPNVSNENFIDAYLKEYVIEKGELIPENIPLNIIVENSYILKDGNFVICNNQDENQTSILLKVRSEQSAIDESYDNHLNAPITIRVVSISGVLVIHKYVHIDGKYGYITPQCKFIVSKIS